MPNKTDTTATIHVFTVLTDNQDGGYTMCVYNTQDEWVQKQLEYHNKWNKNDQLTAEEFLERADEDEYKYGYQGNDTIELIKKDGAWQLAEPLHLHAGQ